MNSPPSADRPADRPRRPLVRELLAAELLAGVALGLAAAALPAAAAPAAEPPASAPSATATEAAELPQVTVRSGRHADFERFVFDWPEAVDFVVEREDGRTLVRFDNPARFAPDPSVPKDRFAMAADGRTVVLEVPAATTVRSFSLDDHRVVVDFLSDGESETADAADDGEAADAQLDGSLPPPSPALDALPADADPATLVPLGAMRAELYRRDLMIASLLERLEAVERGTPAGALTPEAAMAESGDDAPASGPVELDASSSATIIGTGAEPAAGPDAAADDVAAADVAPEPGRDSGERAVERALERTLTRAGALLLQPGQLELEPSINYTRRSTSSPVFVSNGDTGVIFVGEDEVERDEVRASLDLKVGLPFDSQVELMLPYYVVDQSLTTMVGGAVGGAEDGTGHAFGNPRLTLAKTLARESGWWPDLVASAYWDNHLGRARDNDIPLTGNFNEVGFGLSAVKRQDPLAFVGGFGVARAFENDGIEPGDTLSFSASAVLAASPATSLRLGFSQQIAAETEVDGDEISGSDRTSGILTLGASAVVGPRALVDVALDVGLNDDAPDYAIRLAVPLRFDFPVF